MKLRYKISIAIIILLLVVVSSIGRSYAIWTYTKSQSSSNLVEAGCLNITYNDLKEDGNTSSINLENAYPLSDDVGKQLSPYKVTITNDCTLAASYDIFLSTFSSNALAEDYLKVYFIRTDDNTIWGPQLINSLSVANLNNSLKNTIEKQINEQIKNSYVLASGVLNPSESKTYELRMWVSKTAPNDTMNKSFKSIVYMQAIASNDHL